VALDPFVLLCRAHGLPEPEREFWFARPRRWRFDYAFVDRRLAVEVEGGAFTRGRHTRGAGFVADLVKYNAAAVAGWLVLRYTPEQVRQGTAVLRDLRACLDLSANV
jgi:very-short-patch-repair endonuclease